MTEAAGEAGQSATAPEAPAVEEDWFKQIPFDPRKGLNSVLPLEMPPLPSGEAADTAENR